MFGRNRKQRLNIFGIPKQQYQTGTKLNIFDTEV
jgi:hypothetical protein